MACCAPGCRANGEGKSKRKLAKNHQNRLNKRGDVDHTIKEIDNVTDLIAPAFPRNVHLAHSRVSSGVCTSLSEGARRRLVWRIATARIGVAMRRPSVHFLLLRRA